jgi:putative glutamine amidotransferase
MPNILLTSTDPKQHDNYPRWLTRLDPSVSVRFLVPGEDIHAAIASADGLLLPGGVDPDPALYGKPELLHFCNVDSARDVLEFEAIRIAVEQTLPIMGICRGMQVMNIALGGTLIADLPSSGFNSHHRLAEADRLHDIDIQTGSAIHDLTGALHGSVNSAHHQGIDLVASRLTVSATAHDGTAEALEWREPSGKPFLLLVHWHPERLPENHPLSDRIGLAFLTACSHTT